VKLRTNTRRFY